MPYRYKITIDVDRINSQQRGVVVQEPGTWAIGSADLNWQIGMHVKSNGATCRLKKFYIDAGEVYLETLLHCNILYFWFEANRQLNIPFYVRPPTLDYDIEELDGDDRRLWSARERNEAFLKHFPL